MNPEQLLAHFDRVSETPDAIPHLRRLILDLAVRGKLVPQDSNDEPVSELLKRIEAEKGRGVKLSRIKNSDPLSPIAPGEYPFGIPAGWIWIRFGLTNELVRGVTYSKSDASPDQQPGFLPILRANNIGISTNYDGLVYVKASRVSPDQFLIKGDYLLALSSGSKDLVGKASLIEADFCGGFGGFCGVVRVNEPSLRPFIGCFLASPYYRSALSKGSRGIGINNL